MSEAPPDVTAPTGMKDQQATPGADPPSARQRGRHGKRGTEDRNQIDTKPTKLIPISPRLPASPVVYSAPAFFRTRWCSHDFQGSQSRSADIPSLALRLLAVLPALRRSGRRRWRWWPRRWPRLRAPLSPCPAQNPALWRGFCLPRGAMNEGAPFAEARLRQGGVAI